MKRLLIILLVTMLATAALAYRIPVSAVMGGGLEFTSLRIRAYRQATNGATITSVKDTTITATGTLYNYSLFVDSLYPHNVLIDYYSGTDTMREAMTLTPVEYNPFIKAGVSAIRDSGQFYAQVGAGGGSGCPDSVGNAWTIVAWDSINSVEVNARISIKPSLSTSTVLGQATSPFTFTKSSGTFYVIAEANGITFPARSIAISGARTDTINGGGFVLPPPPSADLATVFGYLDCPYCDVRFALESAGQPVTDTSTGFLITETVVDTSANAAGEFTMTLPKTQNMVYTSGGVSKSPQWRVRVSPTDVEKEVKWEKAFTIPSDSTSINLRYVR